MEPTHFVYFIFPPRPTFIQDATDEEMAIMDRHFSYLQSHSELGKLMLAGPALDGAFGIGVFNTRDQAEAQQIALGDPAVSSGLMTFKLHPVRLSFLK